MTVEPAPQAVMQCPQCRQLTPVYSTLNDRFALCPPCADKVRHDFSVLTGAKLAKGAAAAAVTAFAVCLVANVLLAILGTSGPSGWIQGLAAIFMGTIVGRTARKWSVAGGIWLQLVTVAITVLAVLEMFAGVIYAEHVGKGGSPVGGVLLGVVGSPLLYVFAIATQFGQGGLFLLFWMFWAIYDPWRATRGVELEVRGPFPVKPAGAPTAPSAPPTPPAAGDARAAGMDFERPQ